MESTTLADGWMDDVEWDVLEKLLKIVIGYFFNGVAFLVQDSCMLFCMCPRVLRSNVQLSLVLIPPRLLTRWERAVNVGICRESVLGSAAASFSSSRSCSSDVGRGLICKRFAVSWPKCHSLILFQWLWIRARREKCRGFPRKSWGKCCPALHCG